MTRARRGRRIAATAISALAHGVLLVVLALHAPTLIAPREAAGPPEPVIPVLLIPRVPPAATRAASERSGVVRLHRRGLQPPSPEPSVEPLPAPPRRAAAEAALAAPGTAPPAPMAEGLREDLRAALRRGGIGCANPQAANLTRAEREACEERLGAGSKAAAYIQSPIAPEVRSYYDAVAKSKEPDGPPTPQKARGRLGMFEEAPVGMKGHGAGLGCRITFGPGGGVQRPAHGLKLGPLPCYVVPPAGSLTPDVDVVNPDSVVRHKKPD